MDTYYFLSPLSPSQPFLLSPMPPPRLINYFFLLLFQIPPSHLYRTCLLLLFLLIFILLNQFSFQYIIVPFFFHHIRLFSNPLLRQILHRHHFGPFHSSLVTTRPEVFLLVLGSTPAPGPRRGTARPFRSTTWFTRFISLCL
uniref:Uncharacterized protein n=1 Tax=Cacopsylla melanoneura TaxID=428564 RepID=A0A8D8YPA8_9HEMI